MTVLDKGLNPIPWGSVGKDPSDPKTRLISDDQIGIIMTQDGTQNNAFIFSI